MLLEDLLAYYNKLERPVANESEAVQLTFGLTLQQIIDVVSGSRTVHYLDLTSKARFSNFNTIFQDEKNQILTTNVWLNLVRFEGLLKELVDNGYILQEWIDVNLAWNESEYGNVQDVRIPPSSLWKPDILMYNR